MSERKTSQRYLSGRVKVTGFSGLSSDRHLYVAPGEVEPNLGYVGEKTIPLSAQYYQLITIENGTQYDRYWQPTPAVSPGGISLFDEGSLVGLANSTSKLNIVGTGVSVFASGDIGTIRVSPPGQNGQILFNDNSDFGSASQFYYNSSNSRVGIGTSIPTQSLDVLGGIRIRNELYDTNNIVGVAGSVLISTGIGVSWAKSVTSRVSIGTEPPSGSAQGDLWWDSDLGELICLL